MSKQYSKVKISKKRKNDIILAAVILVLAAAGFLLLNLTKTPGNVAVVSIDGKVTGEYPLNEDIETVIYSGSNGEYENTLVIKDSTAYVTKANCPDGICVAHRPVANEGESIICLPHKVVVEIKTVENSGVDIAV